MLASWKQSQLRSLPGLWAVDVAEDTCTRLSVKTRASKRSANERSIERSEKVCIRGIAVGRLNVIRRECP